MIRALSDRAIWLEKGKTRLDGSVKQVCDAYQASTILNSDLSATKKVGAPSKPTSPVCIIDVQLVDTSGASFSSATQGEVVTVIIKAKTSAPIEKPIVGFTLHNSLGRSIFGENTYLTFADRPFPLVAGEELEARFTFVMPRLVPGDYSICAAIVDGTQATHVMHDWFPDSLLIRVETGSTTGDLGIPMISIALEKLFSTTGKQKEKT
jgi:lipopolysaccharide transport system ATP-binding protein